MIKGGKIMAEVIIPENYQTIKTRLESIVLKIISGIRILDIDDIYPVGSIYMSANDVDPATLFGGTWERIEGRFLIGATTQSEVGNTGGSADAVVVSHNHTQNSHTHEPSNTAFSFLASQGNIALNETKRSFPSASSSGHYFVYSDEVKGINEYETTSSSTPYINSNGVSGTGKNMPPYLVVNVWKRTA